MLEKKKHFVHTFFCSNHTFFIHTYIYIYVCIHTLYFKSVLLHSPLQQKTQMY